MKMILIAITALALGAGIAQAQDEPLPDSVARAYLAYETALLAGDNEAATAAAGTAWRAARTARIDAELIGILAENYGKLAQAGGAYREAQEAWRDAAEISDRLEAPAPERALRWYSAGVAAFADGAVDDANRHVTRSLRAQPAGAAGRDADLYGNTQYLIAATTAQLGRLSGVGEHARAAIAGFQASGRAYDPLYANAYYLSGIAYFSSGDHAEAALHYNMARGMLAALDESGNSADLRVLGMWLRLSRERLSRPELAQIDAQLAASEFPPPAEPEPTRIPDANNHDAAPIRRIGPNYPREALRRGQQGVVLLQFDVDPEGRPVDIEIVAAIPAGVFEAASVQAVAQWHYAPTLLDGQPVLREGLETTFVFAMH